MDPTFNLTSALAAPHVKHEVDTIVAFRYLQYIPIRPDLVEENGLMNLWCRFRQLWQGTSEDRRHILVLFTVSCLDRHPCTAQLSLAGNGDRIPSTTI